MMVATKSTLHAPLPHSGHADGNPSMFIRSNNVLHKVCFKDILWVHADGNYCYIHTQSRKFAVKVSLKRLLDKLWSNTFIRVHKSYIVQLPAVQRIDLQNAQLEVANQKVPIGRAYKNELMEQLDIL